GWRALSSRIFLSIQGFVTSSCLFSFCPKQIRYCQNSKLIPISDGSLLSRSWHAFPYEEYVTFHMSELRGQVRNCADRSTAAAENRWGNTLRDRRRSLAGTSGSVRTQILLDRASKTPLLAALNAVAKPSSKLFTLVRIQRPLCIP